MSNHSFTSRRKRRNRFELANGVCIGAMIIGALPTAYVCGAFGQMAANVMPNANEAFSIGYCSIVASVCGTIAIVAAMIAIYNKH